VRHSLWREDASVVCQSQSAVISLLSLCAIYILHVIKCMYIQHIQVLYQGQGQYSRSCPINSSSCYNGSLVTWTVVSLTAAKFKPLIFPTQVWVWLWVLCYDRWRPVVLWDVEAPTLSRQSAHRWPWGCQPYAPAALYSPGRFLVLISVRSWVDPRSIVRLERLGKSKNPMNASEIDPATFRTIYRRNIFLWTL
jgi:hypothetical protein